LNYGCVLAVLQNPFRDLVLAREPHVLFGPCVCEEPVKRPDAIGVSIYAIVETDQHQPATFRALVVQLIELVPQCLFVGWKV
jgi:hypothetical protein